MKNEFARYLDDYRNKNLAAGGIMELNPNKRALQCRKN